MQEETYRTQESTFSSRRSAENKTISDLVISSEEKIDEYNYLRLKNNLLKELEILDSLSSDLQISNQLTQIKDSVKHTARDLLEADKTAKELITSSKILGKALKQKEKTLTKKYENYFKGFEDVKKENLTE